MASKLKSLFARGSYCEFVNADRSIIPCAYAGIDRKGNHLLIKITDDNPLRDKYGIILAKPGALLSDGKQKVTCLNPSGISEEDRILTRKEHISFNTATLAFICQLDREQHGRKNYV